MIYSFIVSRKEINMSKNRTYYFICESAWKNDKKKHAKQYMGMNLNSWTKQALDIVQRYEKLDPAWPHQAEKELMLRENEINKGKMLNE